MNALKNIFKKSKTMKRFPEFPMEIQDMIWAEYLASEMEPQTLTVKQTKTLKNYTINCNTKRVPPIMHVSRNAREHGKKYYEPLFVGADNRPKWFNTSIDTLVASRWFLRTILLYPTNSRLCDPKSLDADVKKVKNLRMVDGVGWQTPPPPIQREPDDYRTNGLGRFGGSGFGMGGY